MTTRVVHNKREPYDVYIGRPSKWGNPFTLTPGADRDAVIARYATWVVTQPHLMAALGELRGKVLGCWCAPKSCHGDVLARLADEPDEVEVALSVQQPWASLIVGGPLSPGVKPIENRTWKVPARLIGKRVAIHASKKLDLESVTELQHGMIEGFRREWWPYQKPSLFPTSAIVGVARIVRVFVGEPQGLIDPVYPDGMPDDCKRWYGGPVGFELREVVRIEPVPCKGALGFWALPNDVAAKVRAQLVERAA